MHPGYPAAAERYADFRGQVHTAVPGPVSTPRVGDEDGASKTERERETEWETEWEIQARWFGGEFGRTFTGADGETVEIVQFGHWNRGAGPDFTEAAVRIDGVLHAGAIELDLDVRDWETHGHGGNPAFESVVLHVYTDGPSWKRFFTRTDRHRAVCQVQLPQYAWSEGPPDFLPEAFPGRCTIPLASMPDTEVASLLHSAAQYRMQQKANRLSALSAAVNREQAFFQAVAEALGYSANKTAMAVLAQRCPVSTLRQLDPLEREAVLFGTAGFLTAERFEKVPAGPTRLYLRRLWDCWWRIRSHFEVAPHRSLPWCYSGNRPLNHPERRVAALIALLDRWDSLSDLWTVRQKEVGKIVNNSLNNLSHSFWEYHFTLRSGPSARPMQLIGKSRRHDILGNVVFPLGMGLEALQWEEYASLRGLDTNRDLRRAALRLFGEDPVRQKLFTSYYYQQQGLLQIYRDFCLHDLSECGKCPFPEQLLQWREQEVSRSVRESPTGTVVLQDCTTFVYPVSQ